MKIAQIAPPWFSIPPKHYGGTETVIYNLVEELVRQGHDVTLLAPGDAKTSARLVSFFPQSLIPSGVPWSAQMKAFYHLQKSVEYVKKHSFDIVHAHLSSASDMYLFPLFADLKVQKPVITTLHSRFPFNRSGKWMGDADEYFKEWFQSVPMVAISEHAKQDVPYALNFVGVVHHGLPVDTFHPTKAQPEDYFAWLGRFVPEKGPHLAIQAAKQAGVPLVMAGIVDKDLPEAVRYFEEQIKPHIDDEQIKYIGPAGMKQKISLFSRARGMLNPIQWEEPFGMVMIEAMATGCPVISFDRGAASEVVADGTSGFLVSSLEEMVQKIPQVNELNREAVRDYVVKNFSVQAMAREYVELYKKLVRPTADIQEHVGQFKMFAAPKAEKLLSVSAMSRSTTSMSNTDVDVSNISNVRTDDPVQSLTRQTPLRATGEVV
ncbi:MAG TPA: glycosyltransferase family 4 protein [Ktedonobacter sp.]|nr:glycosyltransferase family 4 protein [Ktedonobacter sp.]